MTLREFLHEARKAFGIVEQNGTMGRITALNKLEKQIKDLKQKALDELRIERAERSKQKRLKRDDPRWGVHMTHCYGWDYDFVEPGEKPTERYSCKYGEDDICPAALYEEPYEAYKQITGER